MENQQQNAQAGQQQNANLPTMDVLVNNPVHQWPAMALGHAMPILNVGRALATASVLESGLQPLLGRLAQLEQDHQTLRQEFDAFRATQGVLNAQAPAPASRAKFPEPDEFHGDRSKFSAFISQLPLW